MPRGEELESATGKVTKVPCRLVCGEILVPQSRHRAPNCAPLRSPDIAGGLGRGILVTLIAVCVTTIFPPKEIMITEEVEQKGANANIPVQCAKNVPKIIVSTSGVLR